MSINPPTWAPITVQDKQTGQTSFNPIWLQYFLEIGQRASAVLPSGDVSSLSTTSSPYYTIAPSLTTFVFSGSVASILYSRGGVAINIPTGVPITVSPGDGINVTFTGTLNVAMIPR